MPKKPSKKFALDLGSDDDDSARGIELKINEEYAKRFEHNKKREEKQRLEEKYKKKRKWLDDSDSDFDSDRRNEVLLDDSDGDVDSSSAEDEDEFGEFADEVADEDILATISAIRSKDPRVYDGQTRFFKSALEGGEDEADGEIAKKEKQEKPMFLKDYHRENLLRRKYPLEDEDDGKPKTYMEEQEALKRDLVQGMHNAAEDIANDGEEGGDFLTTKSAPVQEGVPPPDPNVADPENPDEYLKSFLASKAWLPKNRKNIYGPAMESDDSEEEEIAEQFEQGFNLRFEDPTKAAQLVGHARGAVKAMTARKDGMSSRRRAREAKKLKKEEERKEREIEKGRLRALKVEELMSKVKQIKEVAGLRDGDEDPESWKEFLKGGFNEDKWDEWMAKRFGDDYYGAEENVQDVPKKPTWGHDDTEIGDIGIEGGNEDGDLDLVNYTDAEEGGSKGKRKTRKDYEKEKREKKKRDRETRKEIEKFVDDIIDLDEEVSTGKSSSGFRYREVTPETFGLTPLDILAADDAALNEYAGLKRYATFRPKERKKQDKKKYSKKRNLREWRKAVFGNEDGLVLPSLDAKQAEFTVKVTSKVGEKLSVRTDGGEGEKKRRKRK
ncbi:KRI1-like family C-terminal-domain-containing protein [Tirmania nivea]|nr:KRI1-like family C-terminal-domain-containing protein [Tirmania nivea]